MLPAFIHILIEGVAIEGLGNAGIRHNRIRIHKPAHAGDVVPRVVVDEAETLTAPRTAARQRQDWIVTVLPAQRLVGGLPP
ncbi:MAG: hypothetical protein H6650_12955 [Ardenticatenales bacterium]|nr:hypothetical protein [Ardenticatenales bacterium]